MPYVLTLTIPTFDSYIRMYATDERTHGGCGGGCAEDTMPPPAETAGAKIRANCGSRSSPHPLSPTSTDAVGKRVYRSVSYYLLSLSLSPPLPFLCSLALNVRYRGARCANALTVRVLPLPPYRNVRYRGFNRKTE